MDLLKSTVQDLVQALQASECSSVDLVTACLDRIKTVDPQVKSLIDWEADRAFAAAKAADERRAKQVSLSPLDGIPLALKDILCVEGAPVSCASRILKGYRSPYSATAVSKLVDAGLIPLGRANMDEFAMGSSGESSAYQTTTNPWDRTRTPGGSSSGSAAAVSARLLPLSLGTDTGGSIRQPASLCGIVGLKPTYGRVSRYGLVAFASSLDQIGPFSTDVFGAAALLETIAGVDPRDATSAPDSNIAMLRDLDVPLDGLRIGIPEEYFGPGLSDEVREVVEAALQTYRDQGAVTVPVRLPHTKYAVATYYLIAPSEASSNLSRFDGIHYGHRAASPANLEDLYSRSRGEGFGAEVKRRIMLGAYALSAGYYDQFYVKALKTRRLIRQDFDQAFQECDVIAGPVTPTTAFRLGELSNDPLAMYLSDIYTIPANLAGLPALSIPAGLGSSGLPVGLHLQGPAFSESKLLRAARMLEVARPWKHLVPAS